MVKKPLVKRGATVKHDNHYEAPEVNNMEKVESSTPPANWHGKTVRVKDPETHNLLRALVKANLVKSNSEALEKAVKAYVNGLDENDKQQVRKIAEAYNLLNNI